MAAKWYLENYVNHRDWLLEKLELLQLKPEEALLCLLIDYYNCHNLTINYETLIAKLKSDKQKIDDLIAELNAKGYLQLTLIDGRLHYDLSPLYENGLNALAAVKFDDIFKVYEKSFGRLLSTTEMQKLSDLSKTYDNDSLIEALRVADAYRKLSMSYIEAVLRNKYGQ